jgi:hypothetical protein
MAGTEQRLASAEQVPAVLSTALKEWDIVCRALVDGGQMLLLRKGGIHDVEGVFELQEKHFLLFPTFLHQQPGMVKEARRGELRLRDGEPETITLSGWATVTDIVRASGRPAVDRLFDYHLWDTPQIDMRFNYKPTHPLYVVLLRAYRLPAAVEVANTKEYAGCVSWVPLGREISLVGSVAAMGDGEYERRRGEILGLLG